MWLRQIHYTVSLWFVPQKLENVRFAKGAKPLEQEQKPVEVSLDAGGKLFLDQEELSEAALPARLEKLAARAERPQIYLRADRGLDYGRVMRVMGELNRAGLNRVALVTTEDAGR